MQPARRVVAAVVAGALALAACAGDDDTDRAVPPADDAATAAPTVDAVTVTRDADGRLTITWEGSGDWTSPQTVRVRWGVDPTDVSTGLQQAATNQSRGTFAVDDPKPGARVYFEVLLDGADRGVVAAERRLPLEGQPNFRDLGGYATTDGRRVRWGQLYRGGELGELTEADLEHLAAAGIKTVCDLRSDGEVALLEDVVLPGVDTLHIPIQDDAVDAVAIRNQVLAGDLSGLDPELLVTANRTFVTDFSAEFAAMMQRLMDPGARPAVVHCTAGKDRAGFAAALVLWTLGVPIDTVMQDYLLTNEYRAEENDFALQAVEAIAGDASPLRPLLEARAEYLLAALDAIEQEHGSIDAYLRDGLGIDDDARRAFQDAMLE